MAERGRCFLVPDNVTVQSVLGELGKVGYLPSLEGVYRAYYEYFDTQDGRLMSGDYRLRLCRYCPEQDLDDSGRNSEALPLERGRWQLYYRGALILSQPDTLGGVPKNGAVADHLAGITETEDLLPYLQARVVGQLMTIIPPPVSHDHPFAEARVHEPNRVRSAVKGQTLGLRFENWSFKSPFREGPFRDGWSKQSMIVSVDDASDGPEADTLISFIQKCGGLAPVVFEPLINGLQIIGAARPGAPVPSDYRLSPKDTLYAAVGRIIGRQAFKMWANTEGTLYDLDPEFLHDLRVSTRRARFALKIFGEQVGADLAAELRKELSWAAKKLGRVRDIDVFQDKFSVQFKKIVVPDRREATDRREGVPSGATDRREGVPSGATDRREGVPSGATGRSEGIPSESVHSVISDRVLQAIVEYYRGKREKHRERMWKVLASERYGNLLQGLKNLEGDMLRKGGGVPIVEAVPNFVGAALDRMHVWFERSAVSLTADDLHELRIEFKGLRYTMEFFSDLYVAPMRKAISNFVKFQDCLGLHQDAQAALESLKDFAASVVKRGNPDPELLLAVGSLMQVQRDIQEAQRNLFLGMWNRFPRQVRGIQKLLKSGAFHRKS
jgi:CHAD domain-containing protein